MLAAEAHLVDKRAIVDRGRPRVVFHNRIEDLRHDDHSASGDVVLLQSLSQDCFRFTVGICVCGILISL